VAVGSLVGFFLVFVLATWSLAALTASAHWLLRSRIRTWGPAAEKRLSAMSTILPVVLGALIAAATAVYSAFPELFGGSDHCNVHGHHPHLCFTHGGDWARLPWALMASAAIAALFFVRAAKLATALVAGLRRVHVIAKSSREVSHQGVSLFVAPAKQDYCFAAGYLRPRVFVSTALWDRLLPEQREAILAHEIAHIENRDLWKSLLLSLAEIWGAPFLATRSRLDWDRAAERLCDRVAADKVGDGAIVAEALLAWARGPGVATGLSFSPGADALEERVVAVLSEGTAGHGAALRIALLTGLIIASATVAAVLLADPLHHQLETIFGLGADLL